MFLEPWEDRAAVDAHVAVPESHDFVRAIAEIAAEHPSTAVYEVSGDPPV